MSCEGGVGVDRGISQSALMVLDDVLVWKLPLERWDQIVQIVESMSVATTAGDAGALHESTADLEFCGPVRIPRIGPTPRVPAPPAVRERVNRLVHTLTGETPATKKADGNTPRGKDDSAADKR
jgi:hypothetical protein